MLCSLYYGSSPDLSVFKLKTLAVEPKWEQKSQGGHPGMRRGPPILTPERVQAAVPGEGGCSKTADRTKPKDP